MRTGVIGWLQFFKALCPKEYVKQFENMNDDEIGKFIKDGLTGNYFEILSTDVHEEPFYEVVEWDIK